MTTTPQQVATLRLAFHEQVGPSIAQDMAGVSRSTVKRYFKQFATDRDNPAVHVEPCWLAMVRISGPAFDRLQRLTRDGEGVPEAAGRLLDDMLAVDIPAFLPVRRRHELKSA